MSYILRLAIGFFVLCLCAISKSHSTDTLNSISEHKSYSIVFVYLGDKVPEYVTTTVSQARLFNQDCSIYFILSDKVFRCQKNLIDELLTFDTKIIKTEDLVKSPEHELFERQYDLNPSHPFWKFTTERFYYMEELVRQYDLTDVFQVECDVMLYFNIKDYLPLIHTFYPGMAAPFESDNVGSVSFVYFARLSDIHNFISYISSKYASNNIESDMLLLASYKKIKTDNEIDCLPTIAPQKDPVSNQIGEISLNPSKHWNHIEEWDSIFDPDWLGLYMLKGDWRGNQCFMKPSFYCFRWERDEKGRKIPYAYFDGGEKKYRLNTLHIVQKKFDGYTSIGGRDLPPRVGSGYKKAQRANTRK